MTKPPLPIKPPALNALRAFETAARHGSFAAAAEELGVTAGAVSQHVKALEDWAGIALFDRQAQGVTLTEAGHQVLPAFTKAFNQMAVALNGLRDLAPKTEVRIAAPTALAQGWLSDRLARIAQALPQVAVTVTEMDHPPNLSRSLFDLSLFPRTPQDQPEEMVFAYTPAQLAQMLGGPVDPAHALVLEVPPRKAPTPDLVEVITQLVSE